MSKFSRRRRRRRIPLGFPDPNTATAAFQNKSFVVRLISFHFGFYRIHDRKIFLSPSLL